MKLLAVSFVMATLLAHPATGESMVEKVLAEYRAECVATVEARMDLMYDEDPAVPIELTIDPDSIYELVLGTRETKAIVIFANFNCPSIGVPWCGSGGCNTHIIVNGQVFDHFGYRPFAIQHDGGRRILILPAQGWACKSTGATEPYTAAPCYRAAAWDEKNGVFWTTGGFLEPSPSR